MSARYRYEGRTENTNHIRHETSSRWRWLVRVTIGARLGANKDEVVSRGVSINTSAPTLEYFDNDQVGGDERRLFKVLVELFFRQKCPQVY